MPAVQAFKFSHLSRDPESDAIMYDEYQQKLADELDEMNGVALDGDTDDIPLKVDDTTDPTSREGIEAQAKAEETGNSAVPEKKGEIASCPVCGRKFVKKEANQIYDSLSCANKARSRLAGRISR